jgi:hypothetical protein
MRGPEVTIGVNESTYVGRTQVTVEQTKTKRKAGVRSAVAVSEAKHVVVAMATGTGVVSATVIASGDALGSTRLTRPDAVVAAAHLGHGDGHDKRIIWAMGANESSVGRAAQGILHRKSEEVDIVAGLLDEKGTATGHEMASAVAEAQERKETVLVVLTSPDGNERRLNTQARKGEVIFDTSLIEKESPEQVHSPSEEKDLEHEVQQAMEGIDDEIASLFERETELVLV